MTRHTDLTAGHKALSEQVAIIAQAIADMRSGSGSTEDDIKHLRRITEAAREIQWIVTDALATKNEAAS